MGLEHRFIDCYAGNHPRLDPYVKYIKDKPYLYGTHYLPHDATHDHLTSINTAQEQLEGLGLRDLEIVTQTKDVVMAIEATANKLSTAWMDKDACDNGIKALSRYARKFDKQRNRFLAKPNHDKYGYSDYADALRQWAQGYRPEEISVYREPEHIEMGWMA